MVSKHGYERNTESTIFTITLLYDNTPSTKFAHCSIVKETQEAIYIYMRESIEYDKETKKI